MKSWTTVDKAGWPRGPWDDEPDKVQWIDPDTDLDCLIVRNRGGALCGYVGVPPGHPWHGVDYSDCRAADGCDGDDIICSCRPDMATTVHGGLTYSASCIDTADESTGICHIPEPGRPHDVWWFGFDCAHAWDRTPAQEMRDAARGWDALNRDQTYRDRGYVTGEVAQLAAQIAEVA